MADFDPSSDGAASGAPAASPTSPLDAFASQGVTDASGNSDAGSPTALPTPSADLAQGMGGFSEPSPASAGSTATPAAPAPPTASPASSGTSAARSASGLTDDALDYVDRMAQHGYSAEQIAGGLGVSTYEGGGSLNPLAVNKASGAFGISQDLGSRKDGLAAFLDQRYGTNQGSPTVADETDYNLSELSGPEAAADRAIRAAGTTDDAATAWSHNFERPGAAAEPAEIATAQKHAASYLPYVSARLAELQGQGTRLGAAAGGPNLVASVTAGSAGGSADDAAWDEALRARARALGKPDPTLPGPPRVENVQLPPSETSPTADPWGEALRLRDQARARAAGNAGSWSPPGQPAAAAAGGSVPPPGSGIFRELGHDVRLLPGAVARGLTDLLGTPADVISAKASYDVQNPQAAVDAAVGGPSLADVGPSLLPAQPGASSPISALVAPATSRSITALANRAGAALGAGPGMLNSPAESGDYDVGHNAAFGLGRFVGASIDPLNPLGVIGVGRALAEGAGAAGRAAAGAFGTHVLAPAAIAGGADLGTYAAGALGGSPAEQRFAAAAAIPLGILARGAAEGVLLGGIEKGKSAAGAAGDLLSGKATPIFDNPAGAADALRNGAFESGLPHPGAGLPAGYIVPGATASMDVGGQAFFAQTVHDDRLANGAYRDLLDGNTAALHGALPGGDPADAVGYVRSVQDARQQTVDMRVAQAKSDADLAQTAASRGTAGQGMLIGAPGKADLFNYANEVVNQLAGARDDARAMADDAWNVARQGGFTTATTDTRPMYNALEGLAQRSIQNLQAPGTFPYRELAPLYQDGDLRGMFDATGVRKPSTIAAGAGNGPNATLAGPATLDTLHSLQSSLGASIRQEQDALRSGSGAGSSVKLANLTAVRNVVAQTIETGAMAAGNYASMRNALNASATYHNTFGQGILGDILASADRGNAPQKLASYLGNSTKAQTSAAAFANAVALRNGAGEARAAAAPGAFDAAAPGMGSSVPGVGGNPGAAPAEGMRGALADWLRQDYLLVRSEGGPLAGQKWQENNAAFLSGAGNGGATDPFSRLNDDVTRLNQSDAALPQLRDAAARDQDSVEVKMAQAFLGANEGKEIEAALRGQAPAQGMQRLIGMVRQDATGQAFRGLQRMMFDRVMAAAQKYPEGGTGAPYYSGRAAQAFMQANRGAFSALRNADPVVGGNLDKLVNGLAAEDAIRARPQVAGLPKSLSEAAPVQGQGLVGKVMGAVQPFAGRILGNRFLGPVFKAGGSGGIQAHALGAEAGASAIGGFYKAATGGKEAPHIVAMNSLRDAMFDPAAMQRYLDAQQAAFAQAGIAPPSLAEVGLRGAATGHRAAVGAAQLGATPPPPPPPVQKPGVFSPVHPWVRAVGVEAAHSMLNSGQTTPPIQHTYPPVQPPPVQPPRSGTGSPWDAFGGGR
jgi:hypothetical protein